jgi:prepilin-type N-terminal cleavage/methylation domain-containing protein
MRLQGLASCPLRLIEASRQATASRSGFTLLELILAVTVFAIIGGATAIPFASRFFNKNNLENKTNEVVSALFTAKLNSVSGKEHSQWGVHIDSTHIIMFKGSSYVPPGTTFDQTYDIPPTTTITTIDVAFNSTTGNPSAPQTIAISDALGDQHILSVNEVGSIDIN